jgi:hypothetical protein
MHKALRPRQRVSRIEREPMGNPLRDIPGDLGNMNERTIESSVERVLCFRAAPDGNRSKSDRFDPGNASRQRIIPDALRTISPCVTHPDAIHSTERAGFRSMRFWRISRGPFNVMKSQNISPR